MSCEAKTEQNHKNMEGNKPFENVKKLFTFGDNPEYQRFMKKL
jgi:hypothetical protein